MASMGNMGNMGKDEDAAEFCRQIRPELVGMLTPSTAATVTSPRISHSRRWRARGSLGRGSRRRRTLARTSTAWRSTPPTRGSGGSRLSAARDDGCARCPKTRPTWPASWPCAQPSRVCLPVNARRSSCALRGPPGARDRGRHEVRGGHGQGADVQSDRGAAGEGPGQRRGVGGSCLSFVIGCARRALRRTSTSSTRPISADACGA